MQGHFKLAAWSLRLKSGCSNLQPELTLLLKETVPEQGWIHSGATLRHGTHTAAAALCEPLQPWNASGERARLCRPRDTAPWPLARCFTPGASMLRHACWGCVHFKVKLRTQWVNAKRHIEDAVLPTRALLGSVGNFHQGCAYTLMHRWWCYKRERKGGNTGSPGDMYLWCTPVATSLPVFLLRTRTCRAQPPKLQMLVARVPHTSALLSCQRVSSKADTGSGVRRSSIMP